MRIHHKYHLPQRFTFLFLSLSGTVADYEASRLAQAKAIGAETLHLNMITKPVHGLTSMLRSIAGEHGTLADALMKTLGTDEIDVAIDAAGFECNGRHGQVH